MNSLHLKRFLAFAGVAIAGYLFLANLGSGYLWQDEAQTALISRTVLHGGIPKGFDGKNYFSQELGAEYGPGYVWKWHTWLPFYVLAGFFKAFGESTAVARLPFALFGLATVFLTYGLAWRLFKNRRLALLSVVTLTASVAFLLLSRQCRYYSLTAFFFCGSLLCYESLLERKKHAWILWLASSTLLFHSHFIYFFILLATVLLHSAGYHRERWRSIAWACAGSALLNAPWMIWLSSMPYQRVYTPGILNLPDALRVARGFVVQFTTQIWNPTLWILVLFLYAMKRWGRLTSPQESARSSLGLLGIALLMHLTVLSLTAPDSFFRYLTPVIPLACILAGWVLDRAWTLDKRLGAIAMAGVVLSQPLGDFFYELTHTYRGPVEGMVEYLKAHAKPTDVVAISYEDLPLKFYTDLRVVGGLTGEDLSPVDHADWVLWRNHIVCSKDAAVAHYITQHVLQKNYRPILLESPDIEFQNSEALGLHRFRTVTDELPVIIYQKMR